MVAVEVYKDMGYHTSRRKKMESLGLCWDCAKSNDNPTGKRCLSCSKKMSFSGKVRRDILIEKGLCGKCGKNRFKEGAHLCVFCLEKANERSKKHNDGIKKKVFNHYGNRCNCCNESMKQFLAIDHINNDGAKHRKKIGSGYAFYLWLIRNNFPTGFQTLCANCNWGKRVNNNICPHLTGGD